MPSETVTQGMIVTVLARMAKVDTSKYAAESYADVPENEWYTDYTKWAKKVGSDVFSAAAVMENRLDGGVFKEGTPAFSKYGEIPLIPTQLIEIFCLCIIFVVVKKFSKNKFADYIVLYSIQRFFIEFLRGDDRGNGFLMFSHTQTVCIAMIAFILIYGIIKRTRKVILSVWQG